MRRLRRYVRFSGVYDRRTLQISAGLKGQAGVCEQGILKISAACSKLLRPKSENGRRSSRVTHYSLDFRTVPGLQSFERLLAQFRVRRGREKHQDFNVIFRRQRQVPRCTIATDHFRYVAGTN